MTGGRSVEGSTAGHDNQRRNERQPRVGRLYPLRSLIQTYVEPIEEVEPILQGRLLY